MTATSRALVALSEREAFWTSLRDRAKANLLPHRCEWLLPAQLAGSGAPDAFAIVVDVPTVPNWEALIAGNVDAKTYVVLLGANAVVRTRAGLRTVVAALNFDDAVGRLRLVVRRNTSSRLLAPPPAALATKPPTVPPSSANPKQQRRSSVDTIRPSLLGIPQRFSLISSPAASTPSPAASTPPAAHSRAPNPPESSQKSTVAAQAPETQPRGVLPTMTGIGEPDAAAATTLANISQPTVTSPPVAASVDSISSLTTPVSRPSTESYNRMTIAKALEDGMKIDGVIAVAIADWNSGLTLGTAGGGERLNIDVAAAANCNVVKAKMTAMQTLGIKGSITDILITLDDQIHVIRPLRKYPELFYYIAFDKARGNLGLTRHRIEAIEKDLTL